MRIYVREKTDPISAFLNPPDQVVQPTKLHGCRYGVGRPSLTSLDSRFAHGDNGFV